MLEWIARRDLSAWAREVAWAGLAAGSSGNVSVRWRDGFIITPTGCRLGDVTPRDLVVVVPGGEPAGEASAESPLHRETYARRADVTAVVHTHSPYATALAGLVDGGPEGLAVSGIGCHAPGSGDLAEACSRVISAGTDVVLAEGHGVFAVAGSLSRAVSAAEMVEQWAQTEWLRLMVRGGMGSRD